MRSIPVRRSSDVSVVRNGLIHIRIAGQCDACRRGDCRVVGNRYCADTKVVGGDAVADSGVYDCPVDDLHRAGDAQV